MTRRRKTGRKPTHQTNPTRSNPALSTRAHPRSWLESDASTQNHMYWCFLGFSSEKLQWPEAQKRERLVWGCFGFPDSLLSSLPPQLKVAIEEWRVRIRWKLVATFHWYVCCFALCFCYYNNSHRMFRTSSWCWIVKLLPKCIRRRKKHTFHLIVVSFQSVFQFQIVSNGVSMQCIHCTLLNCSTSTHTAAGLSCYTREEN